MNFSPLPTTAAEVDATRWASFAPYFEELQQRELTAVTLRDWLEDWSQLSALVHEAGTIVNIDTTLDTTDTQKEQAFLDFVSNVSPQAKIANKALIDRLLESETSSADLVDLTLMLRDMRNEADLFRAENVPLQTELAKLINQYDKITGGLKMDWDGEEKNLSQLYPLLLKKDRAVRERAWRAMMALWQDQRQTLNKLFREMLLLRQQIADNAGLADYREYAFREYGRFDYTPDDCFTFHKAIEEVVVPAARRIYAKKRRLLGLESLQPWDVDVDPSAHPPLTPYQGQDELVQGSLDIFQQVDPELARYFATMAEEQLLDLDTRSGKALGGYCATLFLRQRPFIFMNGTGTHNDVQTMLHEAGHAFHAFESGKQALIWQQNAPMEFCEVASTSMELLSAPHLTKANGGFYTEAEAARAQIEYLESTLLFFPYMAVVDAFQHWVYTHVDEALDATRCDVAWDNLWARFMPDIDWRDFPNERMTGWHRKLHIFHVPFYYVEYGIALIGALQVWRNAQQGQAEAVAAYRHALALGATKTLPELFVAAGAEFRFDSAILSDLVTLIEDRIAELENGA